MYIDDFDSYGSFVFLIGVFTLYSADTTEHDVSKFIKRYLNGFVVLGLMFLGLPTLARDDFKQDPETKSAAERERLIKKTEEMWAKSGKDKLVEFLSTSVDDPLKEVYLEAVLKRLSEIGNQNYPKEISELTGVESVIISFDLSRSGDLIGARIIQPSKHKIINDYMLRVLELGQPFPQYVDGAFAETIEKVVITKAIEFNNVSAKAYSK